MKFIDTVIRALTLLGLALLIFAIHYAVWTNCPDVATYHYCPKELR